MIDAVDLMRGGINVPLTVLVGDSGPRRFDLDPIRTSSAAMRGFHSSQQTFFQMEEAQHGNLSQFFAVGGIAAHDNNSMQFFL